MENITFAQQNRLYLCVHVCDRETKEEGNGMEKEREWGEVEKEGITVGILSVEVMSWRD